jgi:hypothetical protein
MEQFGKPESYLVIAAQKKRRSGKTSPPPTPVRFHASKQERDVQLLEIRSMNPKDNPKWLLLL